MQNVSSSQEQTEKNYGDNMAWNDFVGKIFS